MLIIQSFKGWTAGRKNPSAAEENGFRRYR